MRGSLAEQIRAVQIIDYIGALGYNLLYVSVSLPGSVNYPGRGKPCHYILGCR